MAEYDVIVIGGGINGISCAAYLGKAGLKTLLLEGKGPGERRELHGAR